LIESAADAPGLVSGPTNRARSGLQRASISKARSDPYQYQSPASHRGAFLVLWGLGAKQKHSVPVIPAQGRDDRAVLTLVTPPAFDCVGIFYAPLIVFTV